MGSYQDLIPDDVRHLDEAAMDQALLNKSLQMDVFLIVIAGVAIEDLARRAGLWRGHERRFELNRQS